MGRAFSFVITEQTGRVAVAVATGGARRGGLRRLHAAAEPLPVPARK